MISSASLCLEKNKKQKQKPHAGNQSYFISVLGTSYPRQCFKTFLYHALVLPFPGRSDIDVSRRAEHSALT